MSIAPPIASNRASSEPSPMWPSATYCATIVGIEAGSVVGDRQDDAVAPARQPDPDGGGLRVLTDVGEQLACRPVQQGLRLRLTHVVEIGLHGQIGARLELPQQFSHRRGEAELGQHLGVQLA